MHHSLDVYKKGLHSHLAHEALQYLDSEVLLSRVQAGQSSTCLVSHNVDQRLKHTVDWQVMNTPQQLQASFCGVC